MFRIRTWSESPLFHITDIISFINVTITELINSGLWIEGLLMSLNCRSSAKLPHNFLSLYLWGKAWQTVIKMAKPIWRSLQTLSRGLLLVRSAEMKLEVMRKIMLITIRGRIDLKHNQVHSQNCDIYIGVFPKLKLTQI